MSPDLYSRMVLTLFNLQFLRSIRNITRLKDYLPIEYRLDVKQTFCHESLRLGLGPWQNNQSYMIPWFKTLTFILVCQHSKRVSTRRIISELLKFPKLSNEFFKLITFICEVYPEKVVGLPENVVDQIVLMLKVGLNKWAPQIGSLPCGSSSPEMAVVEWVSVHSIVIS